MMVPPACLFWSFDIHRKAAEMRSRPCAGRSKRRKKNRSARAARRIQRRRG